MELSRVEILIGNELLLGNVERRQMGEPEDLSDEQLLRRMRAGDTEAFTALYRRRQGGVYRFALQMSGNSALAEEVTQDVFIALIRSSEIYDEERGSVVAFIYGISRNCVLRYLERDRRYVPYEEDTESSNGNSNGSGGTYLRSSDPLADLTRAESILRLRRAVLSLPAKYREVVVLCDLEEFSYEEAARTLGCALGSVRSRLHRARSLLLRKLNAAAEVPVDSSAVRTRVGGAAI